MLRVHWCGFVFIGLSALEVRHVASSVCIEYMTCSVLCQHYRTICCMLYQHRRYDILCGVPA